MGQALDSIDHVEKSKPFKIRPFVAPMIEMTNFKESSGYSLGAFVGTIINENWQAGGFIQTYNGDFNKRVIFPNSFVLDYSYRGVFVDYSVFKTEHLSVLTGLKVASGEASWSLTQTLEIFDTDNFIALNPNIGLDLKFSPVSILNVSVGYRMFYGLDLPELRSSEINNVYVDAKIKIGWFK